MKKDWQFWVILLWLALLTAIAYRQGEMNALQSHMNQLQGDINRAVGQALEGRK